MIASAEQKKNSRGAAINMSQSFSGNAIVGFVTVTHMGDLSHNFMTLGGDMMSLKICFWVNDHGASVSAGAKSSTASGGEPQKTHFSGPLPSLPYIHHQGHLRPTPHKGWALLQKCDTNKLGHHKNPSHVLGPFALFLSTEPVLSQVLCCFSSLKTWIYSVL